MTHPMLYGVSLLFYFCCQLLPGESQTITVNTNGEWTEGETVTLTCTISSYSGQMRWLLGSTDVASCNPDTCNTISTGDGAYFFGFDTTNHIFLWTINPVKKSNNGNIFKCSDGTSTANFTATVKNKGSTTTTTAESSDSDLSIAALCLSIILPFLIVAGLIVNTCCCSRDSFARDTSHADQLWKREVERLERLIDTKIENELRNKKHALPPLKSDLDTNKEIKPKNMKQEAQKKKTEREHNDEKLANQAWTSEFDTMIETKIENKLKKMKLETLKSTLETTLESMVHMKLNDGQFLKMPLVKAQLDISICEGITSWIKERKADNKLCDPDTAIVDTGDQEL